MNTPSLRPERTNECTFEEVLHGVGADRRQVGLVLLLLPPSTTLLIRGAFYRAWCYARQQNLMVQRELPSFVQANIMGSRFQKASNSTFCVTLCVKNFCWTWNPQQAASTVDACAIKNSEPCRMMMAVTGWTCILLGFMRIGRKIHGYSVYVWGLHE